MTRDHAFRFVRSHIVQGLLPLLAATTVTAAVALAPAGHPHISPALAGPAVALTAADLGALDPAAFDPAALPLSFDALDAAGLAAATGWGAAVENAYFAVEQWTQYGANLLACEDGRITATGWPRRWACARAWCRRSASSTRLGNWVRAS